MVKGTTKFGYDVQMTATDICACGKKKAKDATMCKKCRLKFNELMKGLYGKDKFAKALRKRKRRRKA